MQFGGVINGAVIKSVWFVNMYYRFRYNVLDKFGGKMMDDDKYFYFYLILLSAVLIMCGGMLIELFLLAEAQ